MSHLKFLCAFLAVLLLGFTFLNAGEPVKAKWNMRDHIACADVSVFVHRGAGDLAPENALPSLLFTWGLKGCYGTPEVDIRTTKDGILAMFHDGNFRRILPNAPEEIRNKRLEDLTWEEARQLDIGVFRGNEFKGQKIVSLAEICQALRDNPHRKVLIDVKNVVWMGLGAGEEVVGPIIEQLKKDKFANVNRIQIHVPFNEDGTTRPSEEFLAETLDYIHENYPDIEVQLMPWDLHAAETVEHYKRLADLGAAGFGTDRPDICFEAMKQYYAEAGK